MTVWVGLIGLAATLPALFALLVARLVTQLPAVVRGGSGSPAGHDLRWTLVAMAIVLVADSVVAAGREFVQAVLLRRYEEYLLARVTATLSVPGLELFEDPELAARTDRTAGLARGEPGDDLVNGLAEKWAAQVQGLASAILVASVWPVAAAILTAAWVSAGRRLEADYRRLDAEGGLPMRRAGYLKNVALMPAWAKELRIFGLLGWVGAGYRHHRAVVLAGLAAARRVNRTSRVLILAMIVVANAGVLLWAAHSAVTGGLSVGAVTVLVQGLFGMAMLANQQGDLLIGWGASNVPAVIEVERAAASLHRRPSGTRPVGGRPMRQIRFTGVRFAYPGRDVPVFDGLDLTIEAGRSLAIVGLNGAGKTTLAKLLAGLELPQCGRITVDGIDLADFDIAAWRRNVAAIFQDFVHFQLPACDNIGFGAVEAIRCPGTEDLIRQAARRAGADDILARLPHGLATPLSGGFAGGVDLSGGQWQRIALARAMRAVGAGARVLILDEPTAQLDVRAEADVYNRFLDLTRGSTTIVISHRFSTVRRADRIVVLDAGTVREDGSHEDLLAAGGVYARLFTRQARRYVEDPGASHD